MLTEGAIRIGAASRYKEMEEDIARQDDERTKTAFMSGGYTRITTADGRAIPIKGDVTETVSGPNYYVLCMACDWDHSLLSDFDVDTCVVIRDVPHFVNIMESATRSALPNWRFHHNPVEYFDPYERTPNQYFDSIMSKDFRFAYQREYRFVWIPKDNDTADEFKYVDLGPLIELAEIIDSEPLRAQGSASKL